MNSFASQSSSGFSTITDGDFVPGGMTVISSSGYPMSTTPELYNDIGMVINPGGSIDFSAAALPDFSSIYEAAHTVLSPYQQPPVI